MKNVRELSSNLVTASTVDLFSAPVRQTCDPRPRSVRTAIDRSFAVCSSSWQRRLVVRWPCVAGDPRLQRGDRNPNAPAEANRRQFARCHELKRLGAANAQKTSNLATVDEEWS